MKPLSILLLSIILFVSCQPEEPANEIGSPLGNLFDRYEAFQYYMFPEYATYNGVNDYNDRLNDQSLEAGDQYIDSINAFKHSLGTIDREALDPAEQLNYDLFLHILDEDIAEDAYEIGRYLSFTQQNGYHIYFPQLIETQPLTTEKDIKDYFSRLSGFPEQVDNIIEMLRKAKTLDIMLACPISVQVQSQLEGLANTDFHESPLYKAIEKSAQLAQRSEELEGLLTQTVQPAYEKLYTFFRDQYHPFCREDVGISAVPGGKEYYEFLTKKYTSTDMSPEEVFEIGMAEVSRIRNSMIATQEELGYGDMDLLEFFDLLRTSPEFYFTDKEDLLQGYRNILSEMDSKLPDLFGRLPETGYDLKEMEPYRAAAAPTAYYYPSPADGSRPGYFYVNTYQLDARPIYTMTALALHEAVPGHHLQFAIAKELENVPWFRNQMRVTAFEEGWGLYAEYLGYESGMYDDPLQKLGALSFEMWRACRLVVDVGVHYKGWSREQALNFLKENAPLTELDMNSEIDRYISWPGQALAYKIGEITIKGLRTKAEKALGDEFDVREFHDVVLANGAVPLELLQRNVDAWIDSRF